MKTLLLYISFIFGAFGAYSQVPSINCGTNIANQWPVQNACNLLTFDVPNGSVNSWYPLPPATVTCSVDPVPDQWCWFIANSNTTTVFYDEATGQSDDAIIHVFDLGPGGATGCPTNTTDAFACVNAGGNDVNETLVLSGATATIPGNYYAVRIQENGGSSLFGSLCVTSPFAATDNPCGAPLLPVNPAGACSMVQINNTGATNTAGVPAPGCAGYSGGDVWLSLVVPASGNVVLDTDAGALTGMGMAAYSGACGSLTLIECDDSNSGNDGDMPLLALSGQAPGTTIYIRFWDEGNNANGTFSVCATNNTAPSNDEPCSATPLSVFNACVSTNGTNFYSTDTQIPVTPPAPGCAGYSGGDVWYTTVIPSSGTVTITTNANGMTDSGIAVYSGACGALALYACDDNSGSGNMSSITVPSGAFPVGTTLWIRVWENGDNANGTFSICATTPPNPAGDDPCTAGEYIVNPNGACGMVTLNNIGATNSPGIAAPGCGNYAGGDVWMSLIVPANGNLVVDTDAGSLTNIGMAAYSGTCGIPASLTLIQCDSQDSGNDVDMPLLAMSGLTPGSTIYIRIWDENNNDVGDFGFCATNSAAPSNDEPCNATLISAGISCNYSNITNFYATESQGPIPAPGCAGYTAGDIWYRVVVPSTGTFNIETNTGPGTVTNSGMAIYTGPNCNTLTLVQCEDTGGPGSMAQIDVTTAMTPGTTVWIRVWENGDNNNGTMQICAYETSLCNGNPANNDYCETPAQLTWDPNGSFAAATANSYTVDNPVNMDGNGSATGFGCGSLHNNSWFQFTATDFSPFGIPGYDPNNSTDTFSIVTLANCDNAGNGIQAHIYDVTTDANGCCTAFSSVSNCYGAIDIFDIPLDIVASGLVAGNTYVLMIDGYAGNNCDFVIDGWMGTGILPVDMVELFGVSLPDRNVISWKTLSEFNNAYFEVLRTSDGIEFEVVETVAGAGTTIQTNQYSIDDYDIRLGTQYYRVDQIDIDGSRTSSETITLERKGSKPGIVSVYPNPTSDDFVVELQVTAGSGATLTIEGLNGKIYETRTLSEKGVYKLNFNGTNMSSGMYLIRYIDENFQAVEKLIKN